MNNGNRDASLKTLAFKAYLTPAQQETVDQWLQALKWVWNRGLRLLEEFEDHNAWHKPDKKYYPCSPVWSYRKWEKDADGNWQPSQPYCDLRKPWLLPGVGSEIHVLALSKVEYSLTAVFSQKYLKDLPQYQWFLDLKIPSGFVRGTIRSLANAWKEYKKKKRKRPRYKRRTDKITTLINKDSKSTKVKHRAIYVTNLGWVKTDNSLDERWLLQEPVSALKLTKKPSGYYIQLSGNIPYDLPPANDQAVGIDVGAKYVFATSEGETVDPPRYRRKAEKRLARLQRSLSRRHGGRKLQKGEQPSKRYLRRQRQIARQHEKVADQRRLFNHQLSTDLVKRYGGIVAEDIQLTNLTRRAKPKPREDGKGYERNNASAKSGLTKSLLDNGLGQLLQFIETKATVTGGEFIRVNPKYTSQECSNCGTLVKKALSQRTHTCPNCGYVGDRDVNAAKVILSRGLNLFNKNYLGSTGKVTDGESDSQSLDEPSNYVKRKTNEHRQLELCLTFVTDCYGVNDC